ncbi:hypothetical protein SUDANB105_07500 [Streptomyces sp. enrichment culture]
MTTTPAHQLDISRQTVLVSGANRGLGRRLAQEFLTRGAKVYAGARRPETVDLPGVTPLALDVTDADSVAAAAAAAGDVTVLINNAGSHTGVDVLTGDLADVRLELETHYLGSLAMIRALAPTIAANGGGAILNVLSVLAWVNYPPVGAYGAAKSAAWSMTNVVRQQLAPEGIRVSALHVGWMDTDMAAGVTGAKSDPGEVARLAVDGLRDRADEIVIDELSRRVRAALSGGVAALYPQLSH